MESDTFQEQTLHLLERIAQSQTALEARLAAMETILTHRDTHTQPQHPAFPQFRQLPPELRHRVWSLVAIPSRVLRLDARNRKKTKTSKSPSSPPPLLPPTTAGACRESRAVATKYGALARLTYEGNTKGEGARTRCYWFDGSRDVLEIDGWIDVEGDSPRGIRDLVQRARHVLVGRAEAEWYARLFEQATLVKRVSLKFDFVGVRCSTHGRDAVRRMFGGGGDGEAERTIVVTDLEDADEIARVKSVLGSGWRNPVFLEFDLELWARSGTDRMGRAVRDEKWMRRLNGTWMSEVARGWVMARAAAISMMVMGDGEVEAEGGREGDGGSSEARMRVARAVTLDAEDEFTKEALLGMPEVRFVRAFHLDEDYGVCHS
ncbi:hypothetical protein BDP55DRAFT_653078 [Colletotrichum godetiae]|uniref:2EXR domain-containing protein n=1 Tax=Colletotrichum godetiae TaxID=1209918 RepID=A0AAJ0AS59_9PEZI|nr:uncharacterized protein BDP55DRAFT_653078 [Colletotrichum godetiae]KAK1689392.1 hypothetical protein BDP55DRAFT_653078 [Colletotrichum godetiae]